MGKTYLKGHSVLDLLEFRFGDNVVRIPTMKVGDDLHAFFVTVDINEPPESHYS